MYFRNETSLFDSTLGPTIQISRADSSFTVNPPELSCYSSEMPCFGSERIFLLSKCVYSKVCAVLNFDSIRFYTQIWPATTWFVFATTAFFACLQSQGFLGGFPALAIWSALKLLTLAPIRGIMPEKHLIPEKEQINFTGEDEIETPIDFVTLGE